MKLLPNVADHVDGDRLWRSILEMSEVGATPNGGSSRVAFSEEDDAGRYLFKSWCEDAGLLVNTDAFGNMYAVRRGRADADPLLIGSHLDTQPNGGRFDGVLGVLGGLEVIRALDDARMETDRPIVLVNWTNEEGAVLTPMMGSAVFTGAMPLADALARVLPDGVKVADALARMRCGAGTGRMGFPLHAYLELHIEQGPILETENLTIGVVTGGIGFRRYLIRFDGQEAHAGPTPMASRRDPVVAAARAVVLADDVARRVREARTTVGTLKVMGGSPNTVAASVEFTLDVRHADEAALAGLADAFLAGLIEIEARTNTLANHKIVADSPPAPFEPRIVVAIEDSAKALGQRYRKLASGAGHDACNMSRKYPVGMVFVPSVNGLSHNEAEFTSASDCLAGTRALAHSAFRLASFE